jgi:hypothetical protein
LANGKNQLNWITVDHRNLVPANDRRHENGHLSRQTECQSLLGSVCKIQSIRLSEEWSDEESLLLPKIYLLLARKKPFAIAQGDMTLNLHTHPSSLGYSFAWECRGIAGSDVATR